MVRFLFSGPRRVATVLFLLGVSDTIQFSFSRVPVVPFNGAYSLGHSLWSEGATVPFSVSELLFLWALGVIGSLLPSPVGLSRVG